MFNKYVSTIGQELTKNFTIADAASFIKNNHLATKFSISDLFLLLPLSKNCSQKRVLRTFLDVSPFTSVLLSMMGFNLQHCTANSM